MPLVPVVDGVAVHDKGRQEEKSVYNGAEFFGEKSREVEDEDCQDDGDKGILEYRGFPIDQLARRSCFAETAFLLVYGQLPSKHQLLCFKSRIRANYAINPKLTVFL